MWAVNHPCDSDHAECDEVSARSNRESLSLVIRFLDDKGAVHECLLALIIQVDSIRAFDLCDAILNKLTALYRSTDFLVGQYFDCASRPTISGIYSGNHCSFIAGHMC